MLSTALVLSMLTAPTVAWQLGTSRHAQRQAMLRMAVGQPQPQVLATVVDPTASAVAPSVAEVAEPPASAPVPEVADVPAASPTARQRKKMQVSKGPFAP